MRRLTARGILLGLLGLVSVVAVAAGVFVVLIPLLGEWIVIAAIVAVVGALVVCLMPVDTLPAVALVVYLFVPRRLLSLSEITDVLTPSLMVIVVWAIRSYTSSRAESAASKAPPVLKFIVFVIVLWFALSVLINRPQISSIAWIFDFVLLVLIPLTVPNAHRAVRPLQTALLASSMIMLVLCAGEFALRSNFLLDPIYRAAGLPDVQHWSVYRAAGTLGHPLYAGLFFAMSFALAFGRRFEERRNVYLVVAAGNMIGVVLTVSRNSLGAIAVGAAAIIIVALFRRSSLSQGAKFLVALLVVVGTFGLTQTPVFQDRLDSAEAQGSTNARDFIVDLSLRTAADHAWLGSGASTSLLSAAPLNPNGVIIENAYLQTLISLGLPGLALLLALLVGGAVSAARRGRFAALGALVAYAFSIGFFNIFEASNPSLILAGVALFMAWRGPEEPTVEDRLRIGDMDSSRSRSSVRL